jgi:DnaK suppressor protein
MNKSRLSQYRSRLEAKRVEVVEQALRARARISVETSADSIEAIQQARDRDRAVVELSNRQGFLQVIMDALQRIDDGAYGTCMHCGEPIGQRRLEAVPWSPFCIRCQEAADRGDPEVLESRSAACGHAA